VVPATKGGERKDLAFRSGGKSIEEGRKARAGVSERKVASDLSNKEGKIYLKGRVYLSTGAARCVEGPRGEYSTGRDVGRKGGGCHERASSNRSTGKKESVFTPGSVKRRREGIT